MKHFYQLFLLTMLFSMFGAKTYAHDIAVENADGVMIYYNYINDGKELEVTQGEYEGNIAGQMVGSSKCVSESTIVSTSLQTGEVGIVKIGDKSIKILIK